MGFNFRKSLKIAPGVRLNITKKGISSVSLGGKGARVNLGKKGTRTTVGVPGTGLSYSSFSPNQAKRETAKNKALTSDSMTFLELGNVSVVQKVQETQETLGAQKSPAPSTQNQRGESQVN